MKTHFLLLNIAASLGIATAARSAAEEKSWKGESIVNTMPAKEIKFGDTRDGKQVYFPFSGQLPIIVRDDRDGKLRLHDGRRRRLGGQGRFPPGA